MNKYVGFVGLLCCCVIPAQSSICWVKPRVDFHERMPLILKANTDEFVYPNKCGSKTLQLTIIDGLRAACSSGDTISVFGRDTSLGVASLTCYGVTLFGLSGGSYAAGPFRSIRCGQVPESQVQTTTTTCVSGTISRIGFALSNGSFVPSIEEICEGASFTNWAHHRVVPNLVKKSKLPISGGGLWDGLTGWFQGTTTTTTTVARIGGDLIVHTRLVPRDDMFYRAQQDSTASPINNVPMYRGVYDGNWRLIEEITRKLASARQQCTTLDVWTGRYAGPSMPMPPANTITASTTTPSTTTASTTTASTTTAFNTTFVGTTTPVTTNNRNSRQAGANPPPKFVFKMVVDKVHSRGIVFVTLNDPTITTITPSERICTSHARCTTLYPQFSTVARGYTYCCTLADFATVATEIGLPTFPSYTPIVL